FFWFGAAVLFGLLPLVLDGQSVVYSLRIAGSIVLGGLTTAGVTFLLLERAMRPVFGELFATDAPDGTRMLGIRTRLLVSWALGAAIPLLIIALSYVGRRPEDAPNHVAIWGLVGIGIAVGALVIVTAAQSISEPLDEIRGALARVQRDDLDVDVRVDDGGEVGQLQAGFNRMVVGL